MTRAYLVDPPAPELPEELVKEVYAVFGLAYYLAECLHREMCNYYMIGGFADPTSVTRLRVEERYLEAESLTLGRLLQEISSKLPEELVGELEEAVKRRNLLAHSFWHDRCHLFASVKGCESIISELMDDATLFRETSHHLEHFTWPRFEELGFSEEILTEEYRKLMSGENQKLMPRQRAPKKREQIIAAYEVLYEDNSVLVFESEDGLFWEPSEDGLAWSHFSEYGPDWAVIEVIQKYLPASVDPRPRTLSPWRYDLQIAKKRIIRFRRLEKNSYTWSIIHP